MPLYIPKHRTGENLKPTPEYELLRASEAHDAARKIAHQNPHWNQSRVEEARAWKILVKAAENFLATVPTTFRGQP